MTKLNAFFQKYQNLAFFGRFLAVRPSGNQIFLEGIQYSYAPENSTQNSTSEYQFEGV